MNKADSQRLGEGLERLGYRAIERVEEADIIIVNSCVVRQSAENRVLGKLEALRPLKKNRVNSIIALTGCMVEENNGDLRRRFPHVDLFMKPQEFDELLNTAKGKAPVPEEGSPVPSPPPVSAFVPIIKGCDNFCSYCIVPYRRGRERSRPLGDILCEVQALVNRGAKEVVLLGQNVDSYGHDLLSEPDLADLLAQLNDVEGLRRIRFLTSHPKDMKPKLIDAVARLEKVCEHISLPVQSGDDAVLKAMRRGYTADDYRGLVARIRDTIPGVALSTDVIVGFPGESEEQFQRTYDLLRELGFDQVHVAVYSPRPDTLASRLGDSVSREEKRERLQKIEELQEAIASQINAQLQGRTVEAMVDGRQGGKWKGRTRTDKLVFFKNSADCLGQLVKVKIEVTSPWALQGGASRDSSVLGEGEVDGQQF